jgi:hypothetical protein
MSRFVNVRLPPIGEKEACILVGVLEVILEALWDSHGDAIADWTATHGDLVPAEAVQDELLDPIATDDIPL